MISVNKKTAIASSLAGIGMLAIAASPDIAFADEAQNTVDTPTEVVLTVQSSTPEPTQTAVAASNPNDGTTTITAASQAPETVQEGGKARSTTDAQQLHDAYDEWVGKVQDGTINWMDTDDQYQAALLDMQEKEYKLSQAEQQAAGAQSSVNYYQENYDRLCRQADEARADLVSLNSQLTEKNAEKTTADGELAEMQAEYNTTPSSDLGNAISQKQVEISRLEGNISTLEYQISQKEAEIEGYNTHYLPTWLADLNNAKAEASTKEAAVPTARQAYEDAVALYNSLKTLVDGPHWDEADYVEWTVKYDGLPADLTPAPTKVMLPPDNYIPHDALIMSEKTGEDDLRDDPQAIDGYSYVKTEYDCDNHIATHIYMEGLPYTPIDEWVEWTVNTEGLPTNTTTTVDLPPNGEKDQDRQTIQQGYTVDDVEGYNYAYSTFDEKNHTITLHYRKVVDPKDVPALPASSVNWLNPEDWQPDPTHPEYGEVHICLHCGNEYIYNGGFTACLDCTEKAFAPLPNPVHIDLSKPYQLEVVKSQVDEPVFIPIYWVDANGNKIINPVITKMVEERGLPYVDTKCHDVNELIRLLTSDDPEERMLGRYTIVRGLLYDPVEDTRTLSDYNQGKFIKGQIVDGVWTENPELNGYESVFGIIAPKYLKTFAGWSWDPDVWTGEMETVIVNETKPEPEPEITPEPEIVPEEHMIPQTGDDAPYGSLLAIPVLGALIGMITARRRRA